MAQPQTAPESETSTETQTNSDGKRERSTIGFPYSDLDGAIKVAHAIHDLTGSESELEQIAAKLDQSPKSSGLLIQIASAKVFGLVTGNQGVIALTNLGSRICDQQQEKAARADAFLFVPLYKAIYDKFRGLSLPQDAALENVMAGLGVAQKQKERVRQIFRRSAQQAGFFWSGNDRLVLPASKSSTAAVPAAPAGRQQEEVEEIEELETPEKRRKGKDSGGEEYHPFIQGLLRKLPPPETDWPMEGRAKWLQAAINIFDLMYTDSDDSRRSIGIELKKDSAK
jgi:hypothetical protein